MSGQFPLETEYITAAAEGKESPAYSWDDINGKNDGRAAANTGATRSQVLAEFKEGGSSVAAYIRGFSDEQLDATINLPLAGGAAVATQQLIEGGVLIDPRQRPPQGHPDRRLARSPVEEPMTPPAQSGGRWSTD